MIFTLFLSVIFPILIFNSPFNRKPEYLFSKIFFYFAIPLQALSYTAGSYPDFVDNNFYNTAFRIDLLLQLVFLFLFFLGVRNLKNRIFSKIKISSINIEPGEEYKFIHNVKFVIQFIYGGEKNISRKRHLINLGCHIFLIFLVSSMTLLNLSRFYYWYTFYFNTL